MNIAEAGLQAAVLKVLLDEISGRLNAVKQQTETAFGETGTTQTVPALPDGTKVAAVTLAGGDSKTAYVADENAFLSWVLKEHPEQMELIIRDSYKRGLLDHVKKTGDLVDPATGQVIPGLAVKESRPYVSIRFKPGAKEAVADAWRKGQLAEVEIVAPAEIEAGEAA